MGNRKSAAVFDGTSTTTTNFAYNFANQITSDGTNTFNYDLNGNLTSDGINTYTYDGVNRLLSATGSGNTSTYAYNGYGDRYRQTVNGTQTNYLLDLNVGLTQVLGEFKPGDTTYYLLGLDVIGQQKKGAWSYMGYDGLGSVRHLTDPLGEVLYTASYDPYGVLFELSGTGTSNLGFTGEYTDPNGLLYLRARYMNPAIGTFLSRDPVEGMINRSISRNMYIYASANPVIYVDPSGKHSESMRRNRSYWEAIGVGFAFGAAMYGYSQLADEVAAGINNFLNSCNSFLGRVSEGIAAAGLTMVMQCTHMGCNYVYLPRDLLAYNTQAQDLEGAQTDAQTQAQAITNEAEATDYVIAIIGPAGNSLEVQKIVEARSAIHPNAKFIVIDQSQIAITALADTILELGLTGIVGAVGTVTLNYKVNEIYALRLPGPAIGQLVDFTNRHLAPSGRIYAAGADFDFSTSLTAGILGVAWLPPRRRNEGQMASGDNYVGIELPTMSLADDNDTLGFDFGGLLIEVYGEKSP
jgi:RHS repeat-associated protein